ncbi:MAG TPA: hypothetical protein VHK24_09370 [Steroidobacter sp.]|jgi:hypothetical protein|nr:hypothetical protein [Steroidobacter sp.]
MNRPLFRKWAAWLLPILALRAFLPVGFMLAAEAGGVHLTLCPAQSAPLIKALNAQPASDRATHAFEASQHHHSAPAGEHAQGAHERAMLDSPCPFALAATAAVPAPYLASAAAALADRFVLFRDSQPHANGPVRIDRIRGPPFFS